jgi:alpha-ketoglutarate-dependent taurine dioxygenase
LHSLAKGIHRAAHQGALVKLHPTGRFDNHAVRYSHIEAKPLAAAMGAQISGVALARLSDEQFAEIRHALFRHKMIYFRGQKLTHGEQEQFSLRFGPFAVDAFNEGVTGHRDVHPLIKEADDASKMVFADGWHTDSPFLPEPPSITILRSIQVPPFGGDTMWANSALAYRMLSSAYRRMIQDLRVRFSLREDLTRKITGNTHPLIRTHPATGEKALYVDTSYAIGIEDMLPEESAPIIRFLGEHITQPAFTCRLRWEPDMVALWDNRLCVHQAYNDHQGYRRELYRTAVVGEKRA